MTAFSVVFENEELLVINKPTGISFHDEPTEKGLVSLLKIQCQIDLWPVHRLDKITSGLLIFAKSKQVAAQLGLLFEQKQIVKTYLAISDKKPKKKQGLIKGDMQKSRSGNWILSRTLNNPAMTRFHSSAISTGVRLFVVRPQTGKTHQIRVALKSLGSAILGDTRYGGTKSDRAYLHAFELEFEWNKQLLKINCLPKNGELFMNLSDSIILDLTRSKFEHSVSSDAQLNESPI